MESQSSEEGQQKMFSLDHAALLFAISQNGHDRNGMIIFYVTRKFIQGILS